MTKIISVIQNKGGVGKTTTTQNLGYLFSKLGPALLVDLDSQANYNFLSCHGRQRYLITLLLFLFLTLPLTVAVWLVADFEALSCQVTTTFDTSWQLTIPRVIAWCLFFLII